MPMSNVFKMSVFFLPLLLTGCAETGSQLASLSDGSSDISEFETLISGLAVETSEIHLSSSYILARFDADGDGVLSASEKEAAKETRRAEFLELYDSDQDGVLSKEERQVAHETARAEFLARFDTDGDGQISLVERQQVDHHHPGFGGRFGRGGTDPANRKQAFLERFDANGDGLLSESEKEAIRDDFHPPRMGPRPLERG